MYKTGDYVVKIPEGIYTEGKYGTIYRRYNQFINHVPFLVSIRLAVYNKECQIDSAPNAGVSIYEATIMPAGVISRTGRCASQCGIRSAPALHPQFGTSAANQGERDTRGVRPNFRSARDPCVFRGALHPLQGRRSLPPAVRFSNRAS